MYMYILPSLHIICMYIAESMYYVCKISWVFVLLSQLHITLVVGEIHVKRWSGNEAANSPNHS